MLSNRQIISEKIEIDKIGSTKLSKDQLCQQMCQIDIEKMQSKKKRNSSSSLDNISTACVIGNIQVDNDIDFKLVEPI